MTNKVALASLNASKAWGGAIRPVQPLKRRPVSEDEELNEDAEEYARGFDHPSNQEAARMGFIAGGRFYKVKYNKAVELLKKLDEHMPDCEASKIIKEFLNT